MVVLDRWLEIAIALLRIAVGVIFLWAGLEKLMAPEPFDAAGFLQFGTTGTLGWPFVSGEPAEGTIYNPTHDFWVAWLRTTRPCASSTSWCRLASSASGSA